MIVSYLSILASAMLIESAAAVQCYSCASENMRDNFLGRQRKPPGKIVKEPKVFDNNCDLDIWILRAKGTVECPGSCYKWQQILNNSGVFSYMTVRGCYDELYGLSTPTPHETECTTTINSLPCLAEASVSETQCFCKGVDYCNPAPRTGAIDVPVLLVTFFTLFGAMTLR